MVQCFKPYKGVSSNNKFREETKHKQKVSNPIREYLQIEYVHVVEQNFEFQTL